MKIKNIEKYLAAASLFAAVSPAFAMSEMSVEIDPSKTFQTVDNFAAADAWSGNFVGQYFDEKQKEQTAKWLFSQKIGEDGNPEGIGLSMWRVNLGGGTLEQDGADIMPFQRRAESFLTKDGKHYDWGKCAGQQWFMRKAKEYGCDKFLLFSNTPPVQWTRNGKGYGELKDYAANLKPDCYGKFADYLADVAKHFASEGFDIEYISPVNEPQVPWDSNRQEGTPWLTSEIFKIHVELDRALSERKLDNVKMLLGEFAHPEYAYGARSPKRWNKIPEKERPNLVFKRFCDPESEFFLMNLKHMPKLVGGHAYHAEKNKKTFEDSRAGITEACKKYGVGYQQTEWCFLPCYGPRTHSGLTKDWVSDNCADMQIGLLLGRIIYADFALANSTAWGYWKGMEIKGDYALTGVYPVADGDITKGGVVRYNKLLWALGNYSLFVRPDFKRVEMKGADDIDNVCGLAFISPDGKRLVSIFDNSSFDARKAEFKLPQSFSEKIAKVSAYRTDANMNLGNLWHSDKDEIVLAPRSITTVVFDLK